MRYLFPTPIMDNADGVSSASRVSYNDLPPNDPARSTELRPSLAGYFTGRPGFYNQLLELESMLERLNELPVAASENKAAEKAAAAAAQRALSQVTWLKKDEMSTKLGVALAIGEYRGIVELLQSLWVHPHAALVRDDLCEFLRPASQKTAVKHTYALDPLGRAYATGRRKTSVARVWVWPLGKDAKTPATVTVNRQQLHVAFDRPQDRLSVTAPLRLLNLLSTHGVMCTVRGGGIMGQAGAIRLGVARALERLNPAWRPVLRKAGYLTRDPRMVESKKPGQKKARKKFTWVKR